MNTLDAIYNRRAVKHFDPLHVIPLDIKDKIIDAARHTPSSFNIQHWRLLDVVDPDLRKSIKAASWNQSQVTDASCLFILCVDLKAHEKNPNRYWENAPDSVREFLVPAIARFYDNNNQLQRDEAMRSAGLISQTIMLAAQSLGYDSCPMIGLEFDKVSKLIKLPETYEIAMMLPIGKQTEPAKPRGGLIPLDEFITVDRF